MGRKEEKAKFLARVAKRVKILNGMFIEGLMMLTSLIKIEAHKEISLIKKLKSIKDRSKEQQAITEVQTIFKIFSHNLIEIKVK